MLPRSLPGLLLLCLVTAPADGQGITTVAVRGVVRMADGSDPDGARVSVRHGATGYITEAEVRRGRFLVPGLEPGGPYVILVRRIGAVARRWDGVVLTLGEPLELEVALEAAPVQLDSIVTVAVDEAVPRSHGGTATTLSDSLIHRLPSLNRDVYDFLALVPQISTRIGFSSRGISGSGSGFRANHFLTNGVSERSLSGSQPPEFAGGKSLPFEAVRDYQVLVAPFDVRYGDFAGAMVNTVTRAGSNRFSSTAFVLGRSDALTRDEASEVPFERWQYGLSVSGPVVRDKAHFLVAAEVQQQSSPMTGPYLGQSEEALPPMPVRFEDLARLDAAFRQYRLTAGSAGAVTNRNQIRNLFGRLDATLPGIDSRAVLWVNASDNRVRAFERASGGTSFPLTSNLSDLGFRTGTAAVQLFTILPGSGGRNELSLSWRGIRFGSTPAVDQPLVNVVLPRIGGGFTTVLTGTPVTAQGDPVRMRDIYLRDDITLPLGSNHALSLGVEAEWFRLLPSGLPNAYGTWTFSSLDSLDAGLADRYELARDFGSRAVPISGQLFTLYAGDSWRAGERFSLTIGLRAERLSVGDAAPYNRQVDSLFGRRTDALPPERIELSPRLGFTWELSQRGRDLLRGGVGVFTGRPPLAWYHVPLQNYGDGVGTLRCGSLPGDLGLPPGFRPDAHDPPVSCAGGAGLAAPPRGDVELVDPDIRSGRSLRGVLAYERRLPWDITGTIEGILTRHLSDFVFVNRNLVGPQGTDRRGRVLYGTIDAAGRGRPARVTDSFPSVIELRNVTDNHALQFAASLVRHFENGFAGSASYTWSRVRDVQTPLRVNNRGVVNWSLRAIAGRHEDLTTGVSLNDITHRVTLAGTWRAPWGPWSTELSFIYLGESGSPFTWRTSGAGGRGDLNADGGLNDPIYVPLDARDETEILFNGQSSVPGADNSPAAQAARVAAQQDAFEHMIESNDCLSLSRGRILAPNSCREPWAHSTGASVRQAIPLAGRTLEAQLDIFNVLNLLNHGWGLRRQAIPELLEHIGNVPVPGGPSEPVFRLNSNAADWQVLAQESAFQLQFGLRYRF